MSNRCPHHAGLFRRDQRGAAAVEFVLILPLLIVLVLNITDFGLYLYQAMEVNTAAEAAAQAIFVTCAGAGTVPATTGNCSYSTPESTAADSTSLGRGASISSTTENYYCVNSSGALVSPAGTFPGNKTTDCTWANGSNTDAPGDYVLVRVSFTYSPLYSGISLASLFAGPITRTAWMRLT